MKLQQFEITFLEQMIAHHEMALMMARAFLKNGPDPVFAQFAIGIINAQSLEILQMRNWLMSAGQSENSSMGRM